MPQGVEDWLETLTPEGGRDGCQQDLTARTIWCSRSDSTLNISAFLFAPRPREMGWRTINTGRGPQIVRVSLMLLCANNPDIATDIYCAKISGVKGKLWPLDHSVWSLGLTRSTVLAITSE